jgi:hypothetical protein
LKKSELKFSSSRESLFKKYLATGCNQIKMKQNFSNKKLQNDGRPWSAGTRQTAGVATWQRSSARAVPALPPPL